MKYNRIPYDQFYPLQSHSDVLDKYQELVQNELIQLQSKNRERNVHNLS